MEHLDSLQKDIIKEIRSQFVKMSYLSKNHNNKICIALSGGVDSTLIGLVAHHLGLEVTAISYKRRGVDSVDFNQAKKTCKIMGWNFQPVIIPKENPKKIFLSMINDYGCTLKTEIECLYPFIRIFDLAIKLGFEKIMVGENTTADDRNSAILLRKQPKKYWYEIVNKCSGGIQGQTISMASKKWYQIGKKKGIRVVAPMLGAKYNNVFYKRVLTLKEMNSPYQKSFLKKCFPEEFEKIGMTKTRNLNLQKGGTMTQFFEPLIYDKKFNYNNYKTGDVTKCLVFLAKLYSKKLSQ